MGKIYTGSTPLAKVYDVGINAPLDNRVAVRYVADLITGEDGGIAAQVYKGMIVYVQEDNALYVYTGTSSNTWKTSKGKLVNGGDINNWKRIESFLDPSINLEYYSEKIGARVVETADELESLSDQYTGMLAVVIGGSDSSEDEVGLYILLDGWTKVNAGSGDGVDLSEYTKKSELPTKVSELANDEGYIKSTDLPDFLLASDLEDYVKFEDLEGYLKPEDITDLAKKSDLDGYVKTEDVIDFLTASDLDEYATKRYVDKKIEDLIGGAPETLDTLKEIAEALEDNATMSKVAEAISTKANSADVYTKNEVYTKEEVDAKIDALPVEGSFPELEGSEEKEFVPGLAKVEDVIDYVADAISDAAPDLSGYAKKKDLVDFLTASDLDEYVKLEDLIGYVSEDQIKDFASKSDLDGYVKIEDVVDFLTASDLEPYVKLSELPTKVSDFINDAGYLTEHQDISGKADKSEIPTKVSELDNDEGYLKQEDLEDYVTDVDLIDFATKEELQQSIGSIEQTGEHFKADGTEPLSGSGFSVSSTDENSYVEEIYADSSTGLEAGKFYTSRGLNSYDINGGSELDDISYITLSNGGSSFIRLFSSDSEDWIQISLDDDTLGISSENVKYIVDGQEYTMHSSGLILPQGALVSFTNGFDFTGMLETRDTDPTQYTFGNGGSTYEDVDIYTTNNLPTVYAYADGTSVRVLTEADKEELTTNLTPHKITREEILGLFR